MSRHRIIVADDHPLFRDALKQTLSGLLDDLRLAEAGTFGEVVDALETGEDADLVLLDLKMPGVQGFSGLVYLRAQFPHIPIVIVSATEEAPMVRRAFDLGASGYIPKSASVPEMQHAIRRVLDGGIAVPEGVDMAGGQVGEADRLAQRLASLTPQQMRVLMMLREGLLNKQIAHSLGVSEATIKAHVSAILQKLDVDSRTQAVIAASKIDGEQVPLPS